MADLTQSDWKQQLSEDADAVVIDVRTDNEVALGIIGSAKQIDIYQPQQFLSEIEKLDKSKSYYVYCKAGGRSAQACSIMQQMGFNKTYNLLGGYDQWEDK
ncbi:MAG: rhodanese-like domain-containing protein [bacterium]